ncbi:23S rRNA (pseudouridine(1915)-N(3))-methyltransferase RlmH [Nitrosomonas aestuarii]|uniref:23S rRNA (pseudouridine(1915)-N(3))-methyltransferase RlmH n=1 Tax=Nitrosomonas aestuarii TaxID=52441 RepID=UPI000D31D747|nr:23S rRNA (pseudouridine(1915)-N(3))-methyltransferase RlmH [Nitrosomonas aestuarii]PTN11257.1 23S rRNA (pseudouridine1915-N3)-methyltransferase [Nitrosomonas aestuarii]
MKFYILAVANKLPNWINTAFTEYAKRLSQEVTIHLIEVKPEKRTSNKSTEQILYAEYHRIKAAIPSGCRLIMLDEHGTQWTTAQLAHTITNWMQEGRNTVFIIGGADGLHNEIKSSVHGTFSLSKLTFPHGLVRVILSEQLYRAVTLIRNHPYHRI